MIFLIKTNKMQLFFDYLFLKVSTWFGRFLRPSSGARNLINHFLTHWLLIVDSPSFNLYLF